jgi:hypothetical protein
MKVFLKSGSLTLQENSRHVQAINDTVLILFPLQTQTYQLAGGTGWGQSCVPQPGWTVTRPAFVRTAAEYKWHSLTLEPERAFTHFKMQRKIKVCIFSQRRTWGVLHFEIWRYVAAFSLPKVPRHVSRMKTSGINYTVTLCHMVKE